MTNISQQYRNCFKKYTICLYRCRNVPITSKAKNCDHQNTKSQIKYTFLTQIVIKSNLITIRSIIKCTFFEIK